MTQESLVRSLPSGMKTRWRLTDLELLVLAMAGLGASLFFVCDRYVPLRAAVVLLFAVAGWGLLTAKASPLALLERLMILLYLLPFSVTLIYLFDPDYLWVSTPKRVSLLSDKVLVAQMMTTGLTGLLGLITGMKIAERRRTRCHRLAALRQDYCFPRKRTLDSVQFFGLLAVSIALSYAANGATGTIFSNPYGGTGRSWAAGVGFAGASLLSYLVSILLFVDAEADLSPRRRLKMSALIVATIVIVVLFELIRGNRDAIGLLAALTALYVTGFGVRHFRHSVAIVAVRRECRRRLPLFVLAVVLVYAILGPLRTRLAKPSGRDTVRITSTELFTESFIKNSCTYILLTNVGVASFYRAGTIDYLYGATYLDYLLSIPPGVVARAFGYTRPLEDSQGPNWWFVGVSAGGIHPVAVPFRNFGIFGVFVLLALFGMFIVWADNPNANMWRRFFYAGVIAGSFKWFWYGDMTIIRVIMGTAMLWVLYGVLLHMQRLFVAIRSRSLPAAGASAI